MKQKRGLWENPKNKKWQREKYYEKYMRHILMHGQIIERNNTTMNCNLFFGNILKEIRNEDWFGQDMPGGITIRW